MTQEQIDKLSEINGQKRRKEITHDEAIELIDTLVFGNTPGKTVDVKINDSEINGSEIMGSEIMVMRSVPMKPGELGESEVFEEFACTDEQVAELDSYNMLQGYDDTTDDGGTITLEQISKHYMQMEISGTYENNVTGYDVDICDVYFVQVDADDNSMFSTWMEIYAKDNPEVDTSFFFNDELDQPMECYYIFEHNEDGTRSENSIKFFDFVSNIGSMEPEDKDNLWGGGESEDEDCTDGIPKHQSFTFEEFMTMTGSDTFKAQVKTYNQDDEDMNFRADLQTTVPNKFGHPTLTPQIMKDWMWEHGEEFICDGPLGWFEDDVQETIIAGMLGLSENIKNVLEEDGENSVESFFDLCIDEELTVAEGDKCMQVYCDEVNSRDIPTILAWTLN